MAHHAYTPAADRFNPRLEGLEAREVPTVQLFAVDHTFFVIGDIHSDIVIIRENGKGTITADVGHEHFSATGIHEVKIVDGSGTGEIRYGGKGAGSSVYFHATGDVGGRLVATIHDHSVDHDKIVTDSHTTSSGFVEVKEV